MCNLCCSLTDAEHVLALALYELMGDSYNITVIEDGRSRNREQVSGSFVNVFHANNLPSTVAVTF